MPKLTFVILTILTAMSIRAQAFYTINGTITDDQGNELVGVTVIEQGTSKGATTDAAGKYSLQVSSSNAQVSFSYVGYATQIFAASLIPTTMQMLEEAFNLGDVVVIGYGTQRKKEVTGSVSSVKEEDFNAGAQNSPMGLLAGKVAGLSVSRTAGGDPTNTGYNIQIRGFSTLDKGAGTSPLYIVDGIPVNNIDNISPQDIASMDVLKDGSAAAIYGTRGTNGVIIITTKRGLGTSGSLDASIKSVEYSGYVSIATMASNTGMATVDEFRNLENLSGGLVSSVLYTDADGKSYNTNWMKEITRPAAITHNHNLALSGAAAGISYRGSVAYKNAEGIAKTSNREEIIAKLAADQTALDGWVSLQYDISFMHYRNDFFTGSFKEAAVINPSYPIYDPTSSSGYFMPQGSGRSNPIEAMNNKESYKDGNYFRGSVRPTINIKPIEGLKVSAFGAWEEGNNYDYWYNGIINNDITGSNKAGRGTDRNVNRLFESTVDYARSFGNHRIAAVAGLSYQNFEYDGSSMSNAGFAIDGTKYYSIGDGDADKNANMDISSYRNSNTLVAGFARANYSYDEKYLFSASIRREGSSRFGVNNKWGYFPAMSAGWRLNREEFMQGISWVDELKLRFGFGVTGNNLGSDLQSMALMSNGGSFWYNGQWVYTYAVARNVNPDLKWEKKYEYNLGVDFAIFKNRLHGSIDGYMRQTKDLLWEYDVPTPPYQFPKILANAGEMISKGLEFSITGVPVQTREWIWSTTPTIAFNDNKITKLSDPSKGFNYTQMLVGGVGENGIQNTQTQVLIEGESVGSFYGYKYVGLGSDGKPRYATNEGGITANPTEKDKMVIGRAQPKFTFGWNNTVQYKNFDLSVFFRGVYGNDVLNVTRWAYGAEGNTTASNVFMKDVLEGKHTDKSKFTDQQLENGSYIRLDNLTLGYTLPIKQNKYLQKMRVYFTGQNLFTITGYSGIDPEVNFTGVSNSGIDYPDFYPTVRSFLMGLNITFN
ncbi:MAG: SusC/RagA family TonB-linked outer membrane protein [Bacteroidales bacterium]